ncbi:MAG: fumarylacetoacetase [Pseudomonadales bacterium]|nr:fumarylacetoacetase [Pseudomonadales bacterium]NRA17738.1 fumarylacetoacetase [Oceanospirillaceae bacterium]
MSLINQTHSTDLSSWVESANSQNGDFPIQNLPFAIFRRKNSDEAFRGAVAIGDQVVDLAALAKLELFSAVVQQALIACSQSQLNDFMAMPATTWSALRAALSDALASDSPLQAQLADTLIAQAEIEFDLPCRIGDYTDFYTSINHATTIGSFFRPDNPLLPNYKWVPIGYHGRSSSITVSGQDFHRPRGQTKAPSADEPSLGPCKRLDYEMEVGIYLGSGNEMGTAIDIDSADQHIFGMCLFNDWSARDIQGWEYQPLGPFLAKNFASTVSPWIITNEALAPFRQSWSRDPADPQPLDYLSSSNNSELGAYDIQLQVTLQTQKMRAANNPGQQLTKTSFNHSYWSVAQMVAHHTVNGCNLVAGDFFGSGTQSGPSIDQVGSMMELTSAGKNSFLLDNGESRTFLEDGDAVIMSGFCEAANATRIGFGEVRATILPAKV